MGQTKRDVPFIVIAPEICCVRHGTQQEALCEHFFERLTRVRLESLQIAQVP